MSWTDVFPVLDDDLVDAYEAGVTPDERTEYDAWFAVDRVINRSKARHLVVFSLFWKNTKASEPDLPPLDRETLMKAEEKGLVERFAPWGHYVQPLLDGAKRMREKRPDVGFRIYLAADLHFLIEDFTALGCEVCLMRTSSLRHNPGAMWRFLALEEKKRLVTFSDADRAPLVEADIQRTELMAKIGLGFWRVPVWGEMNDRGMMGYRPVLACQFGTNKTFPAGHLMKALIWHTRKGSISNKCKPPGCGEQVIYGTQWPDYGFDEWFLQSTIFPRAARHGMLSFIPAAAKSRILPLDIEYCTWANPRAEINHFGTDGNCCGGGANGGQPANTKNSAGKGTAVKRHDVIAYTYAETCGLGEAAARNLQAMRDLGLTVEHRIWRKEQGLLNEAALGNRRQLYYHHWHPQPEDKGKRWPKEAFGKARHIAFYAYETDMIPPEFNLAAHAMTEIWVPSTFCQSLFEPLGRPVHVVPHATSVSGRSLKPLPGTRKDHPLTVLFLFDAWSRLPRKNPEAVIRVFREAFRDGRKARLIIKAHHLSGEELRKLHQLCGRDHWITIIDEYLPETELNSLFARADVLLSLQRSEGFGLNLARALAAGLPVVTTGFGGHLDFCTKATAKLVPYSLESAAGYRDPWYAGGNWAAPDEATAVTMLQDVAAEVRSGSGKLETRRKAGRKLITKDFSDAALRSRIAARMQPYFPKLAL